MRIPKRLRSGSWWTTAIRLPPPPHGRRCKIYAAGMQVTYKGRVYEAKWWTIGLAPGKGWWSAWKQISLILDFNKTVKKPFYWAAFQRSAA